MKNEKSLKTKRKLRLQSICFYTKNFPQPIVRGVRLRSASTSVVPICVALAFEQRKIRKRDKKMIYLNAIYMMIYFLFDFMMGPPFTALFSFLDFFRGDAIPFGAALSTTSFFSFSAAVDSAALCLLIAPS